MRQLLALVLGFFSTLSNAQYCTSGGPSSTADSNIESVSLVGDASSIVLSSNCPAQTGIQNLTSLSASLAAGSNYTFDVTFGTCGGNYAGAGEAWIDFNGDGNFDPSESIGTWSGTPPAAVVNMNFNVPAGLTNGNTRMRVSQQEAGSIPLDPCAAFQWGNVIDFGITLTGGIDCSAYIGDDMADAVQISSLPFIDTNDNSFCYSNKNLVYSSPDIFYRILPISNVGSVTATLCGSSYDTFISAIKPDGTVLAFNDDDVNCGNQSTITFTPTANDTIFIVVEGWGNASGQFILNVTSSLVGLNELKADPFVVFPNPAKNEIRIDHFSGNIRVYDFLGKKVLSKQVNTNETIDVSDLKSGTYTIQLQREGNHYVKRLIVQ